MKMRLQRKKTTDLLEKKPSFTNGSFRSQHPFDNSLTDTDGYQPPHVLPGYEIGFPIVPRFGHDFSQVQIHAPTPETMQTKLAINQPGDACEQEADRVAEQVMQMVAPELPETPPGYQHAQLGANDLPTRNVASKPSLNEATSTPSRVDELLSTNEGQPLDDSTRAFMEPRFGHDFSRIRIHTDQRATDSTRSVNALAYTVGQHVVFGDRQYAPETNQGKKLLAHELTHVVQQSRIGASGVWIARAPRSLEVSLNSATLSYSELEEEINQIQQHLNANPVSNEENDRLMEAQDALRKELAKRRKQEEGDDRQRSKVNTSQVPRSLTESLRIDETLSDKELFSEIDAIHATLESRIPERDRVHLQAVLGQLEAEKQRRAHAEQVRHAFTPSATSTDGDGLIEIMSIIESIRPSETASGLYTLVRDREALTLTQEEYNQIRGNAQKILLDQLRHVRQMAEDAQELYKEQKKVNTDTMMDRGISWTLEFFGGIDDPGSDIAQNVQFATVNANAAQALIEYGQLRRGAEFFTTSEHFATITKKASRAYVDNLISTAESTVTVLEYTKTASFLTLGVLTTLASGGATAGIATGIATGAPIAATLGEAGMQVALGEKVDWTKVAVDVAVNLVLARFGGKLADGILKSIATNPEIRSVERIALERMAHSIVSHETSMVFTTVVDDAYKLSKGQPITWDQFTDDLIHRMTDPRGLVIATAMGAVSTAAEVKYGSKDIGLTSTSDSQKETTTRPLSDEENIPPGGTPNQHQRAAASSREAARHEEEAEKVEALRQGEGSAVRPLGATEEEAKALKVALKTGETEPASSKAPSQAAEEPIKPLTTESDEGPPRERYYYGGGEGGRKGMRTLPSSPDVEEAPRLKTSAAELAPGLSDTERAMVNEAEQVSSRLGKPLQVKTKAAAEEGDIIRSGFGKGGGGKELTQKVMDTGEEIGHDFAKNSSLDGGIPGQEKASHAEKLAAIENPDKPLAVDRVMCEDCFAFFQKLAQKRGTTLVVQEPGNTWVFRPDGVRVGLSPNSQVVLHPGGSASAGRVP
jgi:hypothetical protein